MNYLDKIYLGLSTFPTKLFNEKDLHNKCLSASWLNDSVINNFLQEETRNKDIAIVSTRFFVDVKSQRISAEVLRVFSLNEHIGKRLICMPVHKNNNHCYLIVIFPKSLVFLTVEFLGDSNKASLNFIANYSYRYLNYHNIEVHKKHWSFAEHTGFRKQGNAIDCGVYMLTNAYSLILETFPDEHYRDARNLPYWIASGALPAKYDYFLPENEPARKSN